MTNHPLPSISKQVQTFLLKAAREAATHAYCPYSHYPVGAALLTADGQVYIGCNVENISYGLSNCAERTALFKAVSAGCRDFAALAVAGGEKKAAPPCGACRQALAEFCQPAMPVVFALGAWVAGFQGMELGVLVLMASSPSAAAGYSMVRAMGGNATLAANIIALTTLGSLVSTSAGVSVLRALGLI